MQNLQGFLGKIYPVIQEQIKDAQKKVSLEEIKKQASERMVLLVDVKERIMQWNTPSPNLSLIRERNIKISSPPKKGERKREGVAVIAEIKCASPSLGTISDRNILSQVQAYVDGGAVGISVLTEPSYFKGSLVDLTQLKEAFPFIPFLRKDFIISEYQVYQSKAVGADMVLLITQWLEDGELKKLYELTRSLGLHALVEVENEEDFKRALSIGAEIIGINARNLVDLTVDVHRVTRLAEVGARLIAPVRQDIRPILVGESGVDNPAIVREWQAAGVDVVLVGGALMKAEDPKRMIGEFSLVSISSPY